MRDHAAGKCCSMINADSCYCSEYNLQKTYTPATKPIFPLQNPYSRYGTHTPATATEIPGADDDQSGCKVIISFLACGLSGPTVRYHS